MVTQEKEKLDLIISSQRSSIYIYHKKNCPIYKCINCKRVGHLGPLCVDKLKRSKDNNLDLIEIMHLGPIRCGVLKVKP